MSIELAKVKVREALTALEASTATLRSIADLVGETPDDLAGLPRSGPIEGRQLQAWMEAGAGYTHAVLALHHARNLSRWLSQPEAVQLTGEP